MNRRSGFCAGCLIAAAFAVGVGGGIIGAAWWMRSTRPEKELPSEFLEDTVSRLPRMPVGGTRGGSPVERMQRKIGSDPELMAKIEELSEVPEIRALLEDPEIASALENREYMKLMSDPRIREAATHPKMRELTRIIARRAALSVLPFTGGGEGESGERPGGEESTGAGGAESGNETGQ